MNIIFELIPKIMFTMFLFLTTFFYSFFAFKRQKKNRDLVELGIWGVIFMTEIPGQEFKFDKAWPYFLAIVALIVVITKIAMLFPYDEEKAKIRKTKAEFKKKQRQEKQKLKKMSKQKIEIVEVEDQLNSNLEDFDKSDDDSIF